MIPSSATDLKFPNPSNSAERDNRDYRAWRGGHGHWRAEKKLRGFRNGAGFHVETLRKRPCTLGTLSLGCALVSRAASDRLGGIAAAGSTTVSRGRAAASHWAASLTPLWKSRRQTYSPL